MARKNRIITFSGATVTMTKLQIIAKLWSSVYDLIFLVKGTPTKSLEEIETDLDIVEVACRRYADTDDVEDIQEQRRCL